MRDFKSKARGAGSKMKQMAGTSMSQVGHKLDANAQFQQALRGVSEDIEVDSGYTNPFKVHETEKYDIMDEIRDRLSGAFRKFTETVILQRITPGLAQLGINTPGAFLDATKTLLGVRNEVAAQLTKMGELKSSGWKLTRLTESCSYLVKHFLIHAESAIKHEAPVIINASYANITEAHLHEVTADLKHVTVKDEIHRVAGAYGLDAKYLTALLQATAKIHAMQGIEFASTTSAVLSGATETKIIGGVSIKYSSLSHTFTDGVSGSITMSGGMINLNPVVGTAADTPTVVAPVVTINADSWPRQTVFKSQYEGASPHGTNVV